MNVLISALFRHATAPAGLIRRWRAAEFEIVASEVLLGELQDALEYPKVRTRVSAEDAQALLAELRATAEIAPDVSPHGLRSRDPNDDYLLGLAQSVGAVLVTGDKDLLSLRDLPIESSAAFQRRLGRQGT